MEQVTSNDFTRTLDNDAVLPSLPLPSLEDTCKRYLESVKPYLTPEEFQETKAVVMDFENGIGKVLQAKLAHKASVSRNWIKDWWNDTYLLYRGPLPYFNNMGGVSAEDSIAHVKRKRQIPFAAETLYGFLIVYQQLASRQFPTSKFRKKKSMDMIQMYNLFSSGRMPGVERDTVVSSFYRDGNIRVHKHVVVLTRRRFYCIQVMDDCYQPLLLSEIERQLYKVKAMAENKPLGPPVAALTSLPRPEWKQAQDYLFSLSDQNREIVDVINNAIMMCILDDAEPADDEQMKMASGGDCTNKWFDKGFSFITFKNGGCCTNTDHVWCEGMAPILAAEKGREYTIEFKKQGQTNYHLRTFPDPVELEFVVDDNILTIAQMAIQKHNELNDNIGVIDEPFTLYGRKFIKAHSIVGDTYMQMAIQLAYYRVHHRCCPTYETATTRQFYRGRTETARTCTEHSVRWTKAMEDKSVPKATKLALFKEACKRHDQLMDEATEGQGVDRHLFGLRMQAQEDGIEDPRIFHDKAWKASGGDCTFILSTSSNGGGRDHGCVAAMVEDGYGVFYSLRQERFELAVLTYKSSKETNGRKYRDTLQQVLLDLQDLLTSSAKL